MTAMKLWRGAPKMGRMPGGGMRLITLAGALALGAAACSSNGGSSGTTVPGGPVSTLNPAHALGMLEHPPSGSVALQETGSTLLFPLFQIWDPAYSQAYPNITITPAGTGSGTGISQAAAGAVNIGASDAYLSAGQVAQHPGLLNIPLAISAQQINYNVPGVPASTHLKLNGKVLAGIYTGKITKWNDAAIAAINPGVHLPSIGIVALHRSDGSGDTFLFTQYLQKSDPTDWTIPAGTTVEFPAIPNALGANGNGGMVSQCQATPGCVAYIGISYLAKTTAAGLGEAQLENGSGQYELPNAQTIHAEASGFSRTPANEAISLIYGTSAGGYPIINYEYAIVNQHQADATTAQAVKAFLAWCMDPNHGNQAMYLSQVQFQPLPASVLALSVTQLNTLA